MTIFANDLNGEVLKLRKQLVELQSDKAELISQRDTWIGNADALRKQLDEWEEKEAACCPEDFGFEEVIKSLQTKLDVVVEATKALLYAAKMRRNWDILSSDDFDEAYPDECGWAFGDVDENMIQKMEMAQKALAAIEKKRSD